MKMAFRPRIRFPYAEHDVKRFLRSVLVFSQPDLTDQPNIEREFWP